MSDILLNPGPVSLSARVRRAAVRADYCHREPDFLAIQREVIGGIGAVYGCDQEIWTSVALGGSGTTAMEAMLASLIPAGERLLVLENGVYGERLSEIARIHGIAHEAVRFPWGAAPDLEQLRRALAGGGFRWMAAVHHETTTGRLNPLAGLLDLCAEQQAALLADTVSSFGAEDIPFGHSALAACAGTANKCLHGMPGLAFVVVRRDVLDNGAPERSLCLHLPRWAAQQDRDATPFTPPVNAYLALQEALGELAEQGGWSARRARYLELAEAVRAALADCGVEPWLPPEVSASALRSYGLPPGVNYNAVHDGFRQRGFVIYAGQGGLSGEMFRISTMGEIGDDDLARLEQAVAEVFAH
jgi:2-aminoethylphosphonate-pyruvate transaminase